MSQLVWLITGCSSGLGKQFIHSILARGDKVIATSRDVTKIQDFKAQEVSTLELDITSSQESIDQTIKKAISLYGRVDVLVNNASFVSVGVLEELEHSDYLSQFNTNVFGTIKVTRALLPHFRERRAGYMVFIGSLSGWVGHPGVSAYAGSKFALEGIVEALRQETEPLGIKSILIEPGRFRTELLSSANMKAVQPSIPDYANFSRGLLEGLASENHQQPGDPVKLVEIIVDVVRGEGVAKGKVTPFRLPVGTDCFDDLKAKCEKTLELLEEWKDVIRSTDYTTG